MTFKKFAIVDTLQDNGVLLKIVISFKIPRSWDDNYVYCVIFKMEWVKLMMEMISNMKIDIFMYTDVCKYSLVNVYVVYKKDYKWVKWQRLFNCKYLSWSKLCINVVLALHLPLARAILVIEPCYPIRTWTYSVARGHDNSLSWIISCST